MDAVWNPIVSEALEAGLKASNGPVPGAKLRQLIVKTARSRDVDFPPIGHEEESFAEFLKHFSSIVLVRRRQGRDILAAPADKPELFAETTGNDVTRIREDIFDAFTRIPRGIPALEPWYDDSNDNVVWLHANEPSGQLIKMPAATWEQEIEDRKLFISSAEIEIVAKDKISASLEKSSGLGSFSKLIKAHGLSESWHLFRFQAVVRRIKAFSNDFGVPWREDWLNSNKPRFATFQAGMGMEVHSSRHLLDRFVESLSGEDIRRISVPLDIVLKLLQG